MLVSICFSPSADLTFYPKSLISSPCRFNQRPLRKKLYLCKMETTATSPQHTKLLKHAAMQQNFRRLRVQPAISGEESLSRQKVGRLKRAASSFDHSFHRCISYFSFSHTFRLRQTSEYPTCQPLPTIYCRELGWVYCHNPPAL